MGDNSDNGTQAISLPKGGGAIKGIGETFQSNLFSGTGNFSIPIATSPGRGGFGPQLTLQYSTGNGNGPFGLGWQLSIPRITRKTEKGLPTYTDKDVFVMSGAEDLVKVLDNNGNPVNVPDRDGYLITRYRPRTEGLFARIEKWEKNGDVHWRATTKENITSIYGRTENARIIDPAWHADPLKKHRVYEWLLEETLDAKGNHILYEYVQENSDNNSIEEIYEQNRTYAQAYIRRILYGNTPDALDAAKRVGPQRDGTDHENSTETRPRHYLFEVLFDYDDLPDLPDIPYDSSIFPDKISPDQWPVRNDPFSSFRSGFEIRTLRRCERVLMLHHFKEGELDGAPLVKSTDFEYENNADTLVSMLTSAKVQGYRKKFWFTVSWRTSHGTELNSGVLPAMIKQEFVNIGVSLPATPSVTEIIPGVAWRLADDDGTSFNIVMKNGSLIVYTYFSADMPPVTFKYSEFKPHEQRYESVEAQGNDLPPFSLGNTDFSLVDLYGDGLPDVLHTSPTGFRYWQNLGNGSVDRPHPQHVAPAGTALFQPGVTFGDMAGDGLVDLLVFNPILAGFFEATPDGGWKDFQAFQTLPTMTSFNPNDPNVRLIDLTGDGRSDALMTLDHHFLWFECLGEEGYAEAQAIPRQHDLDEYPDVYFNDPSDRVRLSDMTGDGLNDIVLVHNGRIDYWPNLGYGKFGKRITMTQSPRLGYDFDPKRLFLADLDGSGCTDLVYVDFNTVHFWFNQSGNGWSNEQIIHGTPQTTNATTVQFADFFGTGTATFLWSYDFDLQIHGNYKALDFCGGVKPYLLKEMSNNMGATTRVQYAPSTKFYLEDRQKAQPWATHLPFPVQVVEKTEVIDHISKTKLVTTYKYHHGYYDGREREFRGFGRVDQCDTETFESFTQSSLHEGENLFDNKEEAYHVPPVETRTWFHTGIYFDPNSASPTGQSFDHRELTEKYRDEFYPGDTQAFVLDEHEVETGNTPHEAYRALRGAVLRTEVYGRDSTDKADHPYLVTENRYEVKQLQPRDGNNHAVYLSTQQESLTYHYERNPDDPRVTQQLTLQVDDYGNTTDNLTIAYPRRSPAYDEQKKLQITYQHSHFINKDDDDSLYLVGIPDEQQEFEIVGMQWSWPGSGVEPVHFRRSDFASVTEDQPNQRISGNFQPFEDRTEAIINRRLLSWARNYFRPNNSADTTTPHRLNLGQIESLALPYESYQAVFSDHLLSIVYENRLTPVDSQPSYI